MEAPQEPSKMRQFYMFHSSKFAVQKKQSKEGAA